MGNTRPSLLPCQVLPLSAPPAVSTQAYQQWLWCNYGLLDGAFTFPLNDNTICSLSRHGEFHFPEGLTCPFCPIHMYVQYPQCACQVRSHKHKHLDLQMRPHEIIFRNIPRHNTNVQIQPQSHQPTHTATAKGAVHPGTPAALRRFLPPSQSCHTDFKDLPLGSFSFHAITSESAAYFC